MGYVYSQYNSIISLTSVYQTYIRINTEIILSGNIYKTLPISFTVLEQLFLACNASFLDFEDYTGLPFSKIGG